MKRLNGSSVVWSFALGVVLAAGSAAIGCGPKQKFCADAGDGVCPTFVEASAPVDTMDAATSDADAGATYIGLDAPTSTGTAGKTGAAGTTGTAGATGTADASDTN